MGRPDTSGKDAVLRKPAAPRSDVAHETVAVAHSDLTWRTQRDVAHRNRRRGALGSHMAHPRRRGERYTARHVRFNAPRRNSVRHVSHFSAPRRGRVRHDETACATSGGLPAPHSLARLHAQREPARTQPPAGTHPESRHRRPHPQQAGPRPSTLAASPTTPQRPDLTHRTAHMAHPTRRGAPKPSTWRARISHGAPKATWRAVHRPPRPVQRAKTKLSAPRQPLQRARRGDPAEQPVVTGFGRADSGNCRTPRRDWQTCRD